MKLHRLFSTFFLVIAPFQAVLANYAEFDADLETPFDSLMEQGEDVSENSGNALSQFRTQTLSSNFFAAIAIDGSVATTQDAWVGRDSSEAFARQKTGYLVPTRDDSLVSMLKQVKVTTTYQPRELSQPEYLSSWAIKVDSERPIAKGLALETAYQVKRINSEYKEINVGDGFNMQVELGLKGRFNGGGWRLRYRLDDDSREDSRTASSFTSYSAIRNTLSAQLQQRLFDDVNGELVAEYRNSSYKDPNIRNSMEDRRRIDQQTRLKSVLSWNLMANVTFNSEFVYTVNDSNIESYDSLSRAISGKLNWRF